MKKLSFAFGILFVFPLIASAQQLFEIRVLIASIGAIITSLIPILIALALVVFFWGLVRYIWGGTKADHAGGRKIMLAGLISLFVMVSVWGIIRLAGSALGVPGTPLPPAVPTVPQGAGTF